MHKPDDKLLPPISKGISELENHYEVVVVGSGYGGAIVASRMARANRSVCLLERGKEIRPGESLNTGVIQAASA